MTPEQINLLAKIIDFFKWASAPIATLLAGYIGLKLGLKQVRTQKKLDFVERQLREFYSPLLGYRKEIYAKSQVRVKIQQAAGQTWDEICKTKSPPSSKNIENEYEPYKRLINYDNEQFRNELLPLYHKMLSTFRENYWLAEPETRVWYSELCEFVEVWERYLSDTIPTGVIKKLDHSERKLEGFYQELQSQHDILRNKLSSDE